MDTLIDVITGLGLAGVLGAVVLAGLYIWRLGRARDQARGKRRKP